MDNVQVIRQKQYLKNHWSRSLTSKYVKNNKISLKEKHNKG